MIPENWKYEVTTIRNWPFITKLPVCWIVEGTSQLQCLCPNCEYGKGYNEPFIFEVTEKKVLECPSCKIKFIGLV